jgi:hypothetical protein
LTVHRYVSGNNEDTYARQTTKGPYTRLAIYALERLHAELSEKILENRQEHASLSERMRQVEAVIKMLDPNYTACGRSR